MKLLFVLLRHFGVGIALIVAAGAVLLFSDPKWHRQPDENDAPKKIAVVNYISVPVLEDGEAGLLAGLAAEGFVDGENIELKRFNAEGDRSTANLIAREVTGADYDMVLTLSTPMLQAVSAANVDHKRTHVFTLTTDPWGAGVGISRDDPSEHPPYMTGHGTLQPVAEVFRLAREAFPGLKKVGVVWNPSESNSEASTVMAREICRELAIELIEVTVDTSTGVLDATNAVIARDVQAIWAGGDTTVAAALDRMLATAEEAGIPVFTNMPSDVKQGALFSLGADYYEVGRKSGELAARVLRGESTAAIPVENMVPQQLAINTKMLKLFGDRWTFPAEWNRKAGIIVDETGVYEEKREEPVAERRPPVGKNYHVSILYFAPNEISETSIAALKRRLAERGFQSGQNIEYHIEHAQGDLAIIPQILRKLDQSETDLIVCLTTPCLTAASLTVKTKPVVFTEVYDPIAAGAGKTAQDHLPHVTGVGSFPPLEEMANSMQAVVPGLKTVGIVYNDAEANSRKAVSVAKSLLAQRGMQLEEATVSNTSEILQAAEVLVQRNVQVLWEIGDNTVNQGLEALIKTGQKAGIPVVNSDADSCSRGSLVGVGISFAESGYAAGDLVARVLLGENPKSIPFVELAVVRLGVNLGVAKSLKIDLPEDLLARCSVFYGLSKHLGRRSKVDFVQLAESSTLAEAQKGVHEGLIEAGLIEGEDFELQAFSAQGELAQLPQIFQAAIANSPDVIITSTTPAMIAGARATKTIPIVFTVASKPSAVGVNAEGETQQNLTGVYDNPPIDKLLDLAQRQEGRLQTIGTIWDPAEPNSEISVKRLRSICEQRNYRLVERHAASVNELHDVTSAITQTGIDVLVISADNVTSSGFPVIHSVTKAAGIPVYCTEPDLVGEGAAGAVGASFYDWGRQTAIMVARVLAGVKPKTVPVEELRSIRTVTPDSLKSQR